MNARLQFSGPARYWAMSAAIVCGATAEVSLRRMRFGPRCASWNFAMEVGTEIMKRQLRAAFEMADAVQARSYLDSIALYSSELSKVSTAKVIRNNLKGTWFTPRNADSGLTILYLHGGGYSFYPRSFYDNLSALIALSAGSRLFAAEYRLTPEHRFPAQLEDATAAYEWLLGEGVEAERLIVLGDSAGGNLTLALLLSLRGSKLPPPALAICLSPATDFGEPDAAAPVDPDCDWITMEMALQWADWFCSPGERGDPLVSPVNADLRGLPPIYIQAGGAEILLPGIAEFVRRARQQGADVTLETWPEMNHDFQAFGNDVPQSAEAIRRIGEVIAMRLAGKHPLPGVTGS